MAYKKTNWQDTLRDAQGNVIQKGTPLNAQALGKIEDGIVQTEQKIDTEIGKVTTQLAQKADKGESIAITQIDKNKGKFDQSYMSEELLRQIAGDAPINAVPANDSITINHLAITKKSTNLFDKKRATGGFYVSNTSGELVASATFFVSDFITIKPDTSYIKNNNFSYALYTEDRIFIEGGLTNQFTTPSNAFYVRISTTNLETQQLNEGTTLLAYEPFIIPTIKSEYIELVIKENDLPVVKANKLDIMTTTTNLFDKDKVAMDRYINVANGQLATSANFIASDYIEINGGSKYTVRNARQIAFYTAEKIFISAISPTVPYTAIAMTAPENAKYLRFSWFNANLTLNEQQLNVGDSLLPYESFGYVLKSQYVPTLSEEQGVKISIPPKIYGVVGKELNIYFNNIVNTPTKDLMFDVTCTIGKQMSDKWVVTPTAEGNFALTITAYKDYKQVATASTSIVVAATNSSAITKKALIIGDSTVNAGQMTQRLLDITNSDVLTIELLGTRGSGMNKHEGRGGWTAGTYRSNTQYPSPPSANPFYNSAKTDFDFSYYMTQQGYSTVDHVLLCLGINDMFSYTSDTGAVSAIPTILANFDALITSIKMYNSNIKIGVFVTIPPNVNQDAFGEAYANGQTQWRYKRNNAIWIENLINKYKNREPENIYLVPDNTNINPTLFTDAVHPNTAGDSQRGDTLFYYLKNV